MFCDKEATNRAPTAYMHVTHAYLNRRPLKNSSFFVRVFFDEHCDWCRNRKKEQLAHREGRTRSLQIVVMVQPCRARHKSLTLYPIELGGRMGINSMGVT
jgi:hypothetical protein